MKSSITVVAHADNRAVANMTEGSAPEPLVQILILEYGDIKSVTFHPSLAATIAASIKDAGRAGLNGSDYECKFIITDDEP